MDACYLFEPEEKVQVNRPHFLACKVWTFEIKDKVNKHRTMHALAARLCVKFSNKGRIRRLRSLLFIQKERESFTVGQQACLNLLP